MIKIPHEQAVAKIKASTELSEEEINDKIKQKISQLSGLISKEGAAHIVANELGVKLFETGRLKIKNILTGMRSVETVGSVTQVYEVREFVTNGREGKVGSFLIGDDTGVIRAVLWGSQADNLKNMKEGTIVKIKDSYVKENMNGRKELHLNNNSRLILNPEGETVEAIAKPVVIRKQIKELTEQDNLVEVIGTIVQVFEPRFFEICSTCGKRARQRENNFACDVHGIVTPDFSYLINVFLDDGMDNMRVVFFRQQAEKLLGMTKQEIMEFRDFPEKFDSKKNDMLGNMIKITGRVKKNDMFQRLELMVNDVDKNLDPEEEIKRLDEELKKMQEEKTAQPATDKKPIEQGQEAETTEEKPVVQETPQAQ